VTDDQETKYSLFNNIYKKMDKNDMQMTRPFKNNIEDAGRCNSH